MRHFWSCLWEVMIVCLPFDPLCPPLWFILCVWIDELWQNIIVIVLLNVFTNNLSCLLLCRYGAVQRPLLPYEAHLSVDVTSSGESSSGFTSQDSTMERCKTGTLPKISGIAKCSFVRVTVTVDSRCVFVHPTSTVSVNQNSRDE